MAEYAFPQLIILYGPPGCGKGTQANLLSEQFGLEFLDWGHAFRQFAATYKDDSASIHSTMANRVNHALTTGEAILTDDLLFIIGKRIVDLIHSGKNVIMDKPGALPPESQWISSMLKQENIDSAFIHLPLDIEDSVARILHRYYVPSDQHPYPSYEDALKHCPPGVQPMMRKEDQDEATTRTRYVNLYGKHASEILEIYRSKNHIRMCEVDAKQSIDKVHQIILNLFETPQL